MKTDLGSKLVAVMDINILKLFEAQGLKIIKNVGNFDLSAGNHHGTAKRQGFNQKKSTPGSFFDPHSAPKDIDLKDAAKIASNHIEDKIQNHNEYNEVIIVSDAKMLGHIRQHFNNNLKKIISKEISKDMTHHNTGSIEKAIFS